MNTSAKNVVFCLTRGYQGFSKISYLMLVARNLGVVIYLVRTGQLKKTDIILLHEGNLSSIDQNILNFLSFGLLIFKDVSKTFFSGAPVVLGSGERLGYSLMCRFQYAGAWTYLNEYKVCMRVDEDVFLIRAPKLDEIDDFVAGVSSEESHIPTNRSLPVLLSKMELDKFYDHEFPYTNVYISRVNIWLEPEIQRIINKISQHPLALEDRWGDLPVMGVILKAFGYWSEKSTSSEFSYLHLSHFSLVHKRKIRVFQSAQSIHLFAHKVKKLFVKN